MRLLRKVKKLEYNIVVGLKLLFEAVFLAPALMPG